MPANLNDGGDTRLERSCGPSPGDWLRVASSRPGLEQIEDFFSGHAYDPHRHDTYAIGITLSGVQSFDYRGERADSMAGNALVLHPDEVHDGRAGAAGGFRYRMVYIEPRLIRDALGGGVNTLPFVRQPVSSDARLVRPVASALDDLDANVEDLAADQIILSLAEALLALDRPIRAGPSSATCAIAVDWARQFLDEHFDRNVASAELEAVTGLGRFSLARHFRILLGTSPYRYLVMRRLDRARLLLRNGYPIAEVAYASGFADQSHMTRQFRRAYGIPPGRWRSMQQPTRRSVRRN
jgi:AraC-like DNA-binding protein